MITKQQHIKKKFIQKKYNTKKDFFNIKKKKKNLFALKNKHNKLRKKWRFWRGFKQFFIHKKKITFFKKLQWNYNEKRLIWHQFLQIYVPKLKSFIAKKKNKHYFLLLNFLELKLAVVLLRSKFYTKLNNCYDGIKKNLISVNGNIINKKNYQLQKLDLFQKRRHINKIINKKKTIKYLSRIKRLKWRKFRWKKARFLFWKIRRQSNFNLYLSRKTTSSFNFLEINYKIPGGIIIKKPFINEIIINRQKNLLSSKILKKIFFLY